VGEGAAHVGGEEGRYVEIAEVQKVYRSGTAEGIEAVSSVSFTVARASSSRFSDRRMRQEHALDDGGPASNRDELAARHGEADELTASIPSAVPLRYTFWTSASRRSAPLHQPTCAAPSAHCASQAACHP